MEKKTDLNKIIPIVLLAFSGIVVLCACCGFVWLLVQAQNKTQTAQVTAVNNQQVDVSAIQTEAVQTAMAGLPKPVDEKSQITNIPRDTATIGPTNTPRPTNTPKPTDAPPTAPAPQYCKVGQQCQVNGIAVTVLNVSKMDSISIFNPDAGNTYLVLEVVIENISRNEETPYNPMYFSLKDSDGYEYNVTMASPDPSLKSGEQPKGDKTRGYIAFEVKASSTGFIVSYGPMVIFGGYESIRIDLGQ